MLTYLIAAQERIKQKDSQTDRQTDRQTGLLWQ